MHQLFLVLVYRVRWRPLIRPSHLHPVTEEEEFLHETFFFIELLVLALSPNFNTVLTLVRNSSSQ